jgi:hypothetical protein
MSKESWLFLFAAICAVGVLVDWATKAMGLVPQMTRMNWAVVGVVLCLIASGWGFYRSLRMVPGFESGAKQDPINDKQFFNEEVILDGKHFDRCRFENITFVLKGIKPYSLTNCDFYGSIVIKPDNPSLASLLALQKGIGMIPSDTRFIGDGLRNVEFPQKDKSRPTPTP